MNRSKIRDKYLVKKLRSRRKTLPGTFYVPGNLATKNSRKLILADFMSFFEFLLSFLTEILKHHVVEDELNKRRRPRYNQIGLWNCSRVSKATEHITSLSVSILKNSASNPFRRKFTLTANSEPQSVDDDDSDS